MSGQAESNHFFRDGDSVRSADGEIGTIVDSSSLFATVEWVTGRRQEVDQFDPHITVIERADRS